MWSGGDMYAAYQNAWAQHPQDHPIWRDINYVRRPSPAPPPLPAISRLPHAPPRSPHGASRRPERSADGGVGGGRSAQKVCTRRWCSRGRRPRTSSIWAWGVAPARGGSGARRATPKSSIGREQGPPSLWQGGRRPQRLTMRRVRASSTSASSARRGLPLRKLYVGTPLEPGISLAREAILRRILEENLFTCI